MDGKEESLGTDSNSFLGFHSHHICNGQAKKTTHTNQDYSALLSFNVDVIFWTYGIVTLKV